MEDLRNVIDQAKKLILSKNEGQLLQEFIWQAENISPEDIQEKPDVPLNKESAQQDGKQASEGLKTLGTLLITNGEFRKLREWDQPLNCWIAVLMIASERCLDHCSRHCRRRLSEGRQQTSSIGRTAFSD